MLEYSLGHLASNAGTFFAIAIYYKVIAWAIKKTTGKVVPGVWTFILIFILAYFLMYHFFRFDLFVFIKDIATLAIYTLFAQDVMEANKIAESIFLYPLLLFLIVYMTKWTFHELVRLKNFIVNRAYKKQSRQDADEVSTNISHSDKKHPSEELKTIMPIRMLMVIAVVFILIYLFSLL